MERDRKKSPEKVLIVDDLEMNVVILENIIRAEGYEPMCALSVKEALEIMNRDLPQLILSDYSMPEINGVEFCRMLKKKPKTRDIPFMLITVADSSDIKKEAFEAGIVDYITKPFERIEVVMRVNHQMENYHAKLEVVEHNRRMHRVIAEQSEIVRKEQEKLIIALSKVMERYEGYNEDALDMVSQNSRLLAQSLQLTEQYEKEINDEFVDIITLSSKLCNIGKIAVLGGKGKRSDLSDEDYMNVHAEAGEKLLLEIEEKGIKSPYLDMAAVIARYHHARWDGSGYPSDVKGNDIPLEARIVSIINDFRMELYSRKDCKSAFENAVNIICDRSGTYYDPGIIKVFAKITKQLKNPL